MATQFGAGFVLLSATAATTAARLQGVTLNINAGDPVMLRSEGQRYPERIGFADASIDGSFTYSNVDITSLATILGASGTFAATSGTFTVTGGAVPGNFSLQWTTVTDGITSTYTLPRVYVHSFSVPGSRTEHTTFEATFVAQSTGGNVLTVQGS